MKLATPTANIPATHATGTDDRAPFMWPPGGGGSPGDQPGEDCRQATTRPGGRRDSPVGGARAFTGPRPEYEDEKPHERVGQERGDGEVLLGRDVGAAHHVRLHLLAGDEQHREVVVW